MLHKGKVSASEESWRTWIRDNIRTAHPLLWIVESSLACSPRPLRYHHQFGGRVLLMLRDAAPALRHWLESLRTIGIGTIVVLATHGEMKRYSSAVTPDPDLLSLYRSFGFLVHHHPVEDPAHAAACARLGILDQMEKLKPVVLAEYQQRTGAMLIHCRGGMDRTAPIAAFIAGRSVGQYPTSTRKD